MFYYHRYYSHSNTLIDLPWHSTNTKRISRHQTDWPWMSGSLQSNTQSISFNISVPYSVRVNLPYQSVSITMIDLPFIPFTGHWLKHLFKAPFLRLTVSCHFTHYQPRCGRLNTIWSAIRHRFTLLRVLKMGQNSSGSRISQGAPTHYSAKCSHILQK